MERLIDEWTKFGNSWEHMGTGHRVLVRDNTGTTMDNVMVKMDLAEIGIEGVWMALNDFVETHGPCCRPWRKERGYKTPEGK